MTDLWQRLDTWLTNERPVGSWRQQARSVMCREVEAYRNVHADIDAKELLALVDAAYPFGERARHPYKAWLTERKILIEVLNIATQLPAPTLEDYAACEVAIDLFELGDVAGAVRLLDEQAPRRLNRDCPACKAKAGARCVAALTDKWLDEQTNWLVVPHLARVIPHRSNGQLFGGHP